MSIIERYKAWKHKRRWPASEQVRMLKDMLENDERWMAHDPKVVALCQRYSAAVAENWMQLVHMSSGGFRTLIGAEPNKPKQAPGNVRFFPVFNNAAIGPPHQTFYAAAQTVKVVAILRVEVDAKSLLVLSSVMLDKTNAHELTYSEG